MNVDDFDNDLTVPMRRTDRPPPPQPAVRPPTHLDDFDDDLTVPMRRTDQPPPPQPAVRVEPPGPAVTAPGDADLWTPPSRPTRITTLDDSVGGIAWWKFAVAAAVVVAVGVTAFLVLAGGGDDDGQTPAAVESP